MPGTTSLGTPYALPEDPLVQWPATSQSLATHIDEMTTRVTRYNKADLGIGVVDSQFAYAMLDVQGKVACLAVKFGSAEQLVAGAGLWVLTVPAGARPRNQLLIPLAMAGNDPATPPPAGGYAFLSVAVDGQCLLTVVAPPVGATFMFGSASWVVA